MPAAFFLIVALAPVFTTLAVKGVTDIFPIILSSLRSLLPVIILFLVNFIFLCPKYLFVKGKRKWFYIVNSVIILGWRACMTIKSMRTEIPPEVTETLKNINIVYLTVYANLLAILVSCIVVGIAVVLRYIFLTFDLRYKLEVEKRNAAEAELKTKAYSHENTQMHGSRRRTACRLPVRDLHQAYSWSYPAGVLHRFRPRTFKDKGREPDLVFMDIQMPDLNGIELSKMLQKVYFSDITYIEGMKDYVLIHLTSSEEPLVTHGPLKILESVLPKGSFMRVHRSYIVALDKIDSVQPGMNIMIGRTLIHVSKVYESPFLRYLKGRSL